MFLTIYKKTCKILEAIYAEVTDHTEEIFVTNMFASLNIMQLISLVQ
jgi:hypothetical protein